MSQDMKSCVLVVLSNPVAGKDDEYNAWYTKQHLPDVLRVPGFKAARRFSFAGAGETQWKYMAIYEFEAADPAQALAALAARAGTPDMVISSAFDMGSVQMVPWVAITDRVSAA
ncbi:DUF4286 family protein [Acidocella sp. KAb 2-4]|uniref:DUF4286 family protein n=1 Tax=Acidocella sp. KAb 2-4 TaxID=2885158 RepID=UPI001D0884AF|nr:DUF4286 family protein [Acidocella sp. KAb 2-4]MCB5944272.1 hypothetical protein [Acidocella sp. KAb 2-4]